METGQISIFQTLTDATLLTAATGSSQTQSVLEGDKNGSAFAGILRGMTPQASSKPTIAESGVVAANVQALTEAVVEVAPLVVLEMQPEALETLTATKVVLSSDKKSLKTEGTEKSQQEEKVEIDKPEDLMPQEVVMSASGAQIALVPQTIGRMPASDQNIGVQADAVTNIELPVVRVAVSELPVHNNAVEMPLSALTQAAVQQPLQADAKTPLQQEQSATAAVLAEAKITKAAQVTAASAVSAGAAKALTAQQTQSELSASKIETPSSLLGVKNTSSLKVPAESAVSMAATRGTATQQTRVTPSVSQVATPSSALAVNNTSSVNVMAVSAVSLTAGKVPAAQQTESDPPATQVTTPSLVLAADADRKLQATVLVEKAVTTPVITEPKLAVSGSESSDVTAPPEISVTITATSAVPKVHLQQIIGAYSRPSGEVSGTPAAAKVAEHLPVTASVEQSVQQTLVGPATQMSVQIVTPTEIKSAQDVDTAHADVAVATAVVSALQEPGVLKSTTASLTVAVTTEPEQLRSVPTERTIETAVVQARGSVKMYNGRTAVQEEQVPQQTASSDVKTAVNAGEIPEAVKAVTASPAGEDFSSGSNSSSSDRTMNGQVHQVLQQHAKAETVAAAPVTGGTPGVGEQVVKQVSEQLAKHEVKTGSEQIVLRLSPENLGELKVNLRMENQRLTVEIVTENRMVRDAILQNSDTLKESLARQNIRMDSFDVSSGSSGNGSLAGRNGQNQSNWQELNRDRQINQWLQGGGYNVPKDFIPEKLASYNLRSDQGMLDVHF